jgi:hypothetical protein
VRLRELAEWPPNSKVGRGEAEIAGEMREKYYPVEATFKAAPNRVGTWGMHCPRVGIISPQLKKRCGRPDAVKP